MYHALILASRIVAGVVAAVAFYFAFFLYETEEGVWQNRLENLWMSVYDRAKTVSSTSIALFNKIAEILERVFSRMFGHRLLSLHAFVVSVNLSIVGFALRNLVLDLTDRAHGFYGFAWFQILLVCACTALAWASMVSRRRLVMVYTIVPFAILMIVLTLLSFTQFSYRAPSYVAPPHPLRQMMDVYIYHYSPVFALCMSFLADFVAVVIVRKVFSLIARSISISRIALGISILCGLSMFLELGPRFMFVRGGSSGLFWALLAKFNISTTLFCVIPILMLLGIILHRAIWPITSRVLYPLTRYKLMGNRKALVAVGSLCAFYALKPSDVGLKDVLKLFS
jgi:hypothetical protein